MHEFIQNKVLLFQLLTVMAGSETDGSCPSAHEQKMMSEAQWEVTPSLCHQLHVLKQSKCRMDQSSQLAKEKYCTSHPYHKRSCAYEKYTNLHVHCTQI